MQINGFNSRVVGRVLMSADEGKPVVNNSAGPSDDDIGAWLAEETDERKDPAQEIASLIREGKFDDAAALISTTDSYFDLQRETNSLANTLLHELASYDGDNDEQIHARIELLVKLTDEQEASLTIDQANNDGDTALHLAVRNGFKEMAEALKKRGANIETQNKLGETPMSIAVAADNKTMQGILHSVSDKLDELVSKANDAVAEVDAKKAKKAK